MNPINTQITRAFRALICFLSGHGFWNNEDLESCKQIREFLVLSDQRVNLKQWKLSGADLSGSDLSGADLTEADLSKSDLHLANLTRANLKKAILTRSNFGGADLRGADLTWADLCGSHLADADLRGADLRGADFRKSNLKAGKWFAARYCKDPNCLTKFTKTFNPNKFGMIEVDKDGNPINK